MLFAHGAGAYPASDKIFTSVARTATPTPVRFGTTGAKGLAVVINVTGASATPSVVFNVRGVVFPGGNVPGATAVTWDILASAAITGVGTTVLQVHPALTVAANVAASAVLPDMIEIAPVHGDADSITYSVMAVLTA